MERSEWGADLFAARLRSVTQLFRLLTLCVPVAMAGDDFGCIPTRARVVAARQHGLSPDGIIGAIEDGLGATLPAALRSTFDTWITTSTRYRLRTLTVVEADSPDALGALVADPRIRAYFRRLISVRHAEIDPRSLVRFEAVLARRGFGIVLPPKTQPSSARLVLTRVQLQTVLVALAAYRQAEVERGMGVADIDGVRDGVESALTERERREAYRSSPALEDAAPGEAVVGAAVRQRLNAALMAEEIVRIRYQVPGRAAEERSILPLTLYEANGKEYVIGYCLRRKDERLFRLDRMEIVSDTAVSDA